MMNDKLQAVIQGLDNQSEMLNRRLESIITALGDQNRLLSEIVQKSAKAAE
jgi:hypothetical protein